MKDVQIIPFLSECKTKLEIPYITELSISKTQADFYLNNLVLAGKIIDNTGRLQKFGIEKKEELLFTINNKDNKLIFLFIAVVDGQYPMYMEIRDKEIDRWQFPEVKISDDQKILVSAIFKQIKDSKFDYNSIEPKNYYDEYLEKVKEFA